MLWILERFKALHAGNMNPGMELIVDSAKAGSPGGSFGTCSWTYDSDTHTLTVSGTGSTGDFSSSTAKPWADYADEVYDIVVTQGVTALGKHVFSNMKQADTVKLAPSVTAIGRNAFYKCTNLTDVTLPDTIESIGTAAFINTGLASITIPNPDCTIDSLYGLFRGQKPSDF